ncbi:MAG: hypothetical protein ABIC68_04095 [Candidatus Omnitrophota bacterium]
MKVHFFETINIETPFDAIYKRLGYRQDVTKIARQENEKFHGYIQEALNYIKLRGSALRIPIHKKTNTHITLTTGDIFKSNFAALLLKKSSEILLLAATAGSDIIEAIQKSKDKNLTKSVVFDATASEMTDACLTWMINYFNQELSYEGKQLTSKRISCGYGDFSLSHQSRIYELLELKKLNINMTDAFMLVPEKSVTALTGITKKIK